MSRAAVSEAMQPGVGSARTTKATATKGYKRDKKNLNALFVSFVFLWLFIVIGGYMNAATRITAPALLLVLVAIPLLQQPNISRATFSLATISLAGEQAAQTAQTIGTPPIAEAHFHHLHLNTTDPKAAIDFYTSKFDCEKARFANRHGRRLGTEVMAALQ